jgi:hypothetical protein
MRHLLTILAALFLCSAPAQAQTMKALMYNTNGVVAYTNTNALAFTNAEVRLSPTVLIGTNFASIAAGGNFISMTDANGNTVFLANTNLVTFYDAIGFNSASNRATTRTNLGLGKFSVNEDDIAGIFGQSKTVLQVDGDDLQINVPISFFGTNTASSTRANLGLGESDIVTFAGITNNGNVTIANTTATNGILFIRRTNNEPFLGLANLIASNNTTVSNETLFRVGVAEATNKAAQFGFRSTNTNGNGVAVFSVFGFNALMQIGADASTNAVIYSGGGTNNEVMTLIRDGATEFARPLRFSTNASTRPSTNAPANTTNVAAWVEMRIGTNSYRVPLYQ